MASAAVSEVAEKYRTQFHSTWETVRKRGETINEDVARMAEEIKTQLQTAAETEQTKGIPTQISKALQDMTPVDKPGTHKLLLETYLWTTFCLLGIGTGQFFATYFLRYFLSVIFNTWLTVLLAYLIIPLWFFFKDSNTNKTEDERRMSLFGISVALGILSGHNLADLRLSFFTPPAFILPLSIALTAGMIGPTIVKDRKLYLGASLGVAVFVFLIFGLIFRSFRFFYLLWTLVITLIAASDLQIQLGKIQDGTFNGVQAQFSSIATSVIGYAVLLRLFGTHRSKHKA